MKNVKLSALCLILPAAVTVLCAPNAFAKGADGSGGGTGIFCPSSISSQPRAQMLDTYEASILSDATFEESALPYEQQISLKVDRLNFDYLLHEDLKEAVADVRSRVKMLPAGVSIAEPGDVNQDQIAVPLPTGCSLGAVGFYQSDGQLMVSADAFGSLSETQKADFLLHEAVYKLYRSRLVSDQIPSVSVVRKMVAALAAERTSQSDLESLSRPMSWHNIDDSGWAQAGRIRWTVNKGQEGHFPYQGLLTPLLFGKSAKVAVSLNAGADSIVPAHLVFVQLGCYPKQGLPSDLKVIAEAEMSGNGTAVVSAMLPTDCGVLHIVVVPKIPAGSVAFPAYVPSNYLSGSFSLRLNGEILLTGNSRELGQDVSHLYPYTEGLFFPIYYKN